MALGKSQIAGANGRDFVRLASIPAFYNHSQLNQIRADGSGSSGFAMLTGPSPRRCFCSTLAFWRALLCLRLAGLSVVTFSVRVQFFRVIQSFRFVFMPPPLLSPALSLLHMYSCSDRRRFCGRCLASFGRALGALRLRHGCILANFVRAVCHLLERCGGGWPKVACALLQARAHHGHHLVCLPRGASPAFLFLKVSYLYRYLFGSRAHRFG